jgi:hypothetical protein
MHVVADPTSRKTTWTTPTGLTHHSLPPPTLGNGSLTPTQIGSGTGRLTHPTRPSSNVSSISSSTTTEDAPTAEQHQRSVQSG